MTTATVTDLAATSQYPALVYEIGTADSSSSSLGTTTTTAEALSGETDLPLGHSQLDHSPLITGHGNATNVCLQGLLIPIWDLRPVIQPTSERAAWATVYLIFMIFIFIGMSMISDIFVSAIEVIISQKRRVKVATSSPSGEPEYVHVPIWNETVANMTLLVIGSCAPEILLSLIDVIAHNFSPGELGPGVIVGAGAYNLFIIQAICIGSVTKGRTKRIKRLRIYFVSAFWAVFAYFWLFLILYWSSNGLVEIWEAVVTILFFPISVTSAYIIDRNFFGFFSRKHMKRSSVVPLAKSNSPTPPQSSSGDRTILESSSSSSAIALEDSKEGIEKLEHRYLEIVDDLRFKMPAKTMEEINQLAAFQLMREMPKSRGYYRMQTSRGIFGADDVISVKKLRNILALSEEERKRRKRNYDRSTQIVYFDPDTYTVMENCGVFYATVVREGSGLDAIATVDYTTQDGSGKAGVDYDAAKGTIVFNKGETTKQIPVHVIDDEIFNEDTEFFIELYYPRLIPTSPATNGIKLVLGEKHNARVTKVDDDQGGHFRFEQAEMTTEENIGELSINVIRGAGVKGRVDVPITFTPITAVPNVHYVPPAEVTYIVFEKRQIEQNVAVKIINEGKLRKQLSFLVELGEPMWHATQRDTARTRKGGFHRPPTSRQSAISSKKYEVGEDEYEQMVTDTTRLGRPRLASPSTLTVTICESSQLRSTLAEIRNTNVADLVVARTWREQFLAVRKPAGEVDEVTGEPKPPSVRDYILHFLLIFWKILFATIPPAYIWQGWLAFIWSFFYMAIMTAIIGDLASHLGCTIGMHDELTAITFVALGTSLPDMFASRLAAMREETADSAIGHVNGALAVNVFLGIGLAWSTASIVQGTRGHTMHVPPGTIAFSFTIFASFAAVSMFVVMIRRLPPVYGELGGPNVIRWLTVGLFVTLWVVYVIVSGLINYRYILPTF